MSALPKATSENESVVEDGKRKGLGRGLSALLGDAAPVPVGGGGALASPAGDPRLPRELPIEALRPGRYQPRQRFEPAGLDELAQSIRQRGLLQPILVRRIEGAAGHYEIVAGERRWRAAQLARLHFVPVVLKELSDLEALEVALIENIQRQDLTAIEEAAGFQRLMDEFSYTQEQLAEAVGKSRSQVANTLRLLSLPPEVRALIAEGKLSAGQARPLIGRPDAAEIAREIVERGLTAREVEQRLEARQKHKPARTAGGKSAAAGGEGGALDADSRALQRGLQEALGLKVTLQPHGQGGQITIAYQSLEQLDELCLRLRGEWKRPDEEDPL